MESASTTAIIKVTKHTDVGEDEVNERDFVDVSQAVKWLIAEIAGWCVDDDIEIQINGVIFWP